MNLFTPWCLSMSFPARLIQLRRTNSLTQQALADTASLHVNQIRRYEAGTAQPTLEALIRLAKVLHVSLDDLVFDEGERGPSDEFRLRFEAISSFSMEEKQVVKEILDSLILRHQAKQFFTPPQTGR